MFLRSSSSRNFVVIAIIVMIDNFVRVSSYRLSNDDSIAMRKRERTERREWTIVRDSWDGTVGKVETGEFDDKIVFGDRNVDAEYLREGRSGPPPVNEPALMARYVVNQADWASVATISTRKDIPTFPVANVISLSDGPIGNGSGIPYMFLTPLDYTAKDLAADHRATLLVTLAQGSYCKDKQMDPMDPRCARVMLSGKIKKIEPKSSELELAKKVMFGRHPKLAGMPADHHFFFAKLEIVAIAVLDTFGGPKYVSNDDYFNPPPPKDREFNRRRSYDVPKSAIII